MKKYYLFEDESWDPAWEPEEQFFYIIAINRIEAQEIAGENISYFHLIKELSPIEQRNKKYESY